MSGSSRRRFARILLATDGSPSSQAAAEVAATVAKAFGSEVTVLSAIPSISKAAPPMEGEYYSKLVNRADDNADRAADAFKRARVPVTEKEVPQGRSSVVETIAGYAAEEKTDLIVMGTRGLGGFKRALLGSVSSGVAEHAGCATMVVRQKKDRGIGNILVAIDGSQCAQRALEAAVAFARQMKARLTVAHVVFVPTLFWSMGIPGAAVPTDRIQEDAEKAGRQLLAKAERSAKGAGLPDARMELVTDLVSPAQGIVQLAEQERIDLVVVGTRGNDGFRKLLLGSVANSVLHYAECSVMVIR